MKQASNVNSLLQAPRAVHFFLAEDRRAYLGHLSVFILGQGFGLLPPLMVGWIVNFLVAYKPGQPLWPLAAIIVGAAILTSIVAVLRLRSRRKLGQFAVSARYRAKVWGFERLLEFSLSWHQQEGTGNKAQRIITGSEAVREWTNVHNDLVPPIVAFLGIIVACAVLHPLSILFFVAFIVGMFVIEVHFDRKAMRLSQQVNASSEQASGTLVETAANILAVKALGAASSMTARVQDKEAISRQLGHERVRLHTQKWMYFQIYGSVFWALFLGGLAATVLTGAMTIGMVLAYTRYFEDLRSTTTTLADRFQTLIERLADLSRLMPYFAGEFTDREEEKARQDFPRDWQAIELRDVHLHFGERAALAGVSLTIPRGQRLGVAGHSGSGKSSLLKLLLALYPADRGEIRIGDTTLPSIRHDARTQAISVVPQETELFNMSLRDNVTMMREVDAALFQRACHAACLDELIARLPQGTDTALGERGYSLSGGERLRVGIARALCRNPSILLLDEATAALDTETEQTVMTRLLEALPHDITLIVVAHRLHTLAGMQRVIVMAEGRIVEDDAYAALGSTEGGYVKRMLDLQAQSAG